MARGHLTPTHTRFGQRIRAARRNLGWGQRALAETLGVGLGTVSRWESGSYPRTPELRDKVERWLWRTEHAYPGRQEPALKIAATPAAPGVTP